MVFEIHQVYSKSGAGLVGGYSKWPALCRDSGGALIGHDSLRARMPICHIVLHNHPQGMVIDHI